jgi:hypothetical protein
VEVGDASLEEFFPGELDGLAHMADDLRGMLGGDQLRARPGPAYGFISFGWVILDLSPW